MRLRQCGRIVDAIARHGHDTAFGLQFFHHFGLLVRQHLGLDPVDIQFARHGLGGGGIVTREHHDPDAFGVQVANRLGGGCLDGIGHADKPGGFAIEGDEHHGLSFRTPLVRLPDQFARIDALVSHQPDIAQRHHAPVHLANNAFAGHGRKIFRLRMIDAAFFRAPYNGCRQRVFGSALQTGSQPQHVCFIMAVGRLHRHQTGLAFGQRAGLVHHQRIHFFHHFQRFGVLYEYTRRCALARAHHDGHGRRQAQSARTGDDQHRHGVDHRMRKTWLRPPDIPDDKSQN